MRTLFLLGILVALAIIAVKKPEQTAWDAAQDLKEQAKEVIAKVEPPVAESFKPLTRSKTWQDVTESVSKASKALKETETPSPSNHGDINDTGIPTQNWNPNARAPVVEVAPKSSVTALPDIPAVPVPPVQLVEKLKEPKIPPLPAVRTPVRANYADVKVYYEQANRFLDQIK